MAASQMKNPPRFPGRVGNLFYRVQVYVNFLPHVNTLLQIFLRGYATGSTALQLHPPVAKVSSARPMV